MNPQFYPSNGQVLAIDSNGDVYVLQHITNKEWVKLPKLPTLNSLPVESGSIRTLEEFGIKTVEVPAGSFLMGSADDDLYKEIDETPQHKVTLKSFAMSQTLITQAQWKLVATELPKVNLDLDPNPSGFKGPDLPVEKVSWDEAMEFCDRMTQYTQHKITLPSEAQWEYACRAGTNTQYSFGDAIDKTLANYYYSNIKQTTPVYTYPPNPWGLYDMHGNVWEWCLDDRHWDYEGAPTDGSAWYGGKCKYNVVRGGSCGSVSDSCRSAFRSWMVTSQKYNWIGFRIVINT